MFDSEMNVLDAGGWMSGGSESRGAGAKVM